jgi:hypothetical protein
MIDYFKQRDKNSYLNKLKDVFNIISLTRKYKVIGSSNLINMRYNSDFDLADFYNNSKPSINKIIKYFQFIFRTLDKPSSYSYITDFKCGININGEPLKWKKEEVLKEKKLLLDKSYITLNEAMQQKSTIKLDVICFINNTFIEVSENYYIKVGNISNYEDKDINNTDIIKSIKESEEEELRDNNYNKALKRQFSFRYIKNKNDKKLIKLVDFFNSSVGILNKARSDLDVLTLLLMDFPNNIKVSQIISSIDNIKYQVSYNTIKDFTNDFIKIEKIKNKKKLFVEISILRDKIFEIVNELSKKFYKKL